MRSGAAGEHRTGEHPAIEPLPLTASGYSAARGDGLSGAVAGLVPRQAAKCARARFARSPRAARHYVFASADQRKGTTEPAGSRPQGSMRSTRGATRPRPGDAQAFAARPLHVLDVVTSEYRNMLW